MRRLPVEAIDRLRDFRFTNSPRKVFDGITLKDAAAFFSAYLDRPVIDRTGLDGEYDFTFEFRPDPGAPWLKPPAVSAGWPPLMAGFDVPRLAAGLHALGFNLELTTAPFDVLIIEHLQGPASR